MELATKPFPSDKRASIWEAKLAYFEGDFEGCLAICADIRLQSIETASEVALLKARANLRAGRPREAETIVVETLSMHATFDASITAQMLLGTARVRQGDPDGGIAILEDAAVRADRAHVAIRSEIAFSIALGYWAKRDIDTAERYLSRVDGNTDIIHARALDLAAWCEMVRGNYRRSAELFTVTLVRLDSCRARDRAMAAMAISMLAILAAELFDREIARVAKQRAETMDWTPGMVMQRYLTLAHQAMFAEMVGDTVEAHELAIRTREIALTVAYEAYAWSLSSIIARNADEACVAVVFAQRARQLLSTQVPDELEGEERLAVLAVAESCAHFDSGGADQLFAAYRALAPLDTMLALSGDPCLAASESFVSGVIAAARGDVTNAVLRYRSAFEYFARVGYVRRAVSAALALVKLTGDQAMQDYLVEKLAGTSNYITRYLARRDKGFAALEHHPIVATLPRAQREVVLLICQGKSNKEIAVLRNVSEQTIKNMLTKDVFRVFGVSNRTALVSVCLRRTD